MKTRIIEKYHSSCGAWWEIQVKMFFWWVTAPRSFHTKELAMHYSFGDIVDLFSIPEAKVLKKEF